MKTLAIQTLMALLVCGSVIGQASLDKWIKITAYNEATKDGLEIYSNTKQEQFELRNTNTDKTLRVTFYSITNLGNERRRGGSTVTRTLKQKSPTVLELAPLQSSYQGGDLNKGKTTLKFVSIVRKQTGK